MSDPFWGPGQWGLMPWGTSVRTGPLDISYRKVVFDNLYRSVEVGDLRRSAVYNPVIRRGAVLVDHYSRTGSP